MRQFEIQCSRCGKRKRVRWDNFMKTADEWNSGGGTLICPECAKVCKVLTGRDQTIENMVLRLFEQTEPWRGE